MQHFFVTLDVFSGRDNPTWRLADQDSKEFLAIFNEISVGIGTIVEGQPDTTMGYRGYHINSLTYQPGTPSLIRVKGKKVIGYHDCHIHLWHDEHRVLEKWLLEHSVEHVEPAILKRIQDEQTQEQDK